jgi:adenosylcobinamide-GDP ribazoletransferase
MLRPALIAVQFLTRLPIGLEPPPAGRETGLSLLWYPAVGLLLGIFLWGSALLFSPIGVPVAAALALAVWVASTGALHLDGLVDTVDAWVGGRGDREKTLAIMKDPHVGAVGVAALVCLLLIKFGSLSALLAERRGASWTDMRFACGCVLPPLLSRTSVPMLFAQTPYVRTEGLGTALSLYQSRIGARLVGASAALAALVFDRRHGLFAIAIAAVVYVLMRQGFMRRLGGITGDCIGATIEVIEMATLIATLV